MQLKYLCSLCSSRPTLRDTTLCFVRSCSLTWSRSWGPSCASSSCASDWCSRSPRVWNKISLRASKLPTTPRSSSSSACPWMPQASPLFICCLKHCRTWSSDLLQPMRNEEIQKRWTTSDMMVLKSTPHLPFQDLLWTNSQSQIRNRLPPTGLMTRPCTIGSDYLEHHEDAEYRYYYTNCLTFEIFKRSRYISKQCLGIILKAVWRMTEGLHIKQCDVMFLKWFRFFFILLHLHR